MLTTINIDEKEFEDYSISSKSLRNLSKINILIGANNSGKSRFLRKIFSDNNYSFSSTAFDFEKINDSFEAMIKTIHKRRGYGEEDTILTKLSKYEKIKHIKYNIKLNTITKILDDCEATQERLHGKYAKNSLAGATLHTYRSFIEEQIDSWEAYISTFTRYYIPILRGLRPIQTTDVNSTSPFNIHNNSYQIRCVKDYFKDSTPALSETIFTGLNLYNDTQKLLLGNTAERIKIKEFEKFLSVTFFNGENVNIVPRIGEDVLHILIGEDEKAIYDLGDGIQSIIILTYPLFFNQDKNAVFFYEEPELHLHPGLQRIFIETLRRKEFEKFQYFITTHSNHFLDLTLDYSDDISVYTFKKKRENNSSFEIQNVTSSDSNILELIGARNSSVFLSNCTIWVEGITDRLYLRKYLSLYQQTQKKQYKEDLHYSFVEYGGNNITHWSFLDSDDPKHSNINVEKLCGKLFLITDKDNAGLNKDGEPNKTKSAKHERHVKLGNKLGERYYCLNVREIENLLSKAVIRKIIQSYDKNDSLDFTQFNKQNHEAELLGLFINKNVAGLKRNYASASGTITDKVNFCKKAIEQIETFDDLTPESQTLAKKIYEFIEANNK